MNTPAFSVIMPTYNRAHIIGGSIRSVQAQTIPDWELIIIDDRSTDNTRAVVGEFVRADSRIRLIANEGRSGPAGARNTGIRASRAEMAAFLDSDDTWDATMLSALVGARQRRPDAVLIGSDLRMIDHADDSTTTVKGFLLDTMMPWWEGNPLAAAVIPVDRIRRDIDVITEPYVILSMALGGFLWVHTTSVAIRRDAAIAAGLFDERLIRTEDIDLWLRLSRLGPFVYIDETLATYDITGRDQGDGVRYQSYQRQRHSPYIEALYHLRSLDRIVKTMPLDDKQLRFAQHRHIAHHHRCMIMGFRERRVSAIGHLLACLVSREKRDQLRKERATFFRRV